MKKTLAIFTLAAVAGTSSLDAQATDTIVDDTANKVEMQNTDDLSLAFATDTQEGTAQYKELENKNNLELAFATDTETDTVDNTEYEIGNLDTETNNVASLEEETNLTQTEEEYKRFAEAMDKAFEKAYTEES